LQYRYLRKHEVKTMDGVIGKEIRYKIPTEYVKTGVLHHTQATTRTGPIGTAQ
jgi:hypothetical protein